MSGWALLAQTPPNDRGPEFGGSSPVGLVVVLVLAVALAFLLRSMNHHLRKVPPTFDQPTDPSDGPRTDTAAGPRAEPPAGPRPARPDPPAEPSADPPGGA